MQGIITFFNRDRKFFFISVRNVVTTPTGTAIAVDKYFSHLSRVKMFHLPEDDFAEGCLVEFDVDPTPRPGKDPIAIHIHVYPKPSPEMIAAATALSGQTDQKETVGGDL
jgi:hypothetical protein